MSKKTKKPIVYPAMVHELINMVTQIIETNGQYAIEQTKFINSQLQVEDTHTNDGSADLFYVSNGMGGLIEGGLAGHIIRTNVINSPEKIRAAMETNKKNVAINIQRILGVTLEAPKGDA